MESFEKKKEQYLVSMESGKTTGMRVKLPAELNDVLAKLKVAHDTATGEEFSKDKILITYALMCIDQMKEDAKILFTSSLEQ